MNEAESSTSTPASASEARGRPIGSARHFVLACIGLVSWLADELPALLEQSEQQGRSRVERSQIEAKRRTATEVAAGAQAIADKPTEPARRGLPSHQDFEELLQQLNKLERQIDRLATRRTTRP